MKQYTIKEIFYTLQGEGGRAGHPSVFIRFAGCNMWNGYPDAREQGNAQCALWCDTDFAGGTKMTANEIGAQCRALWPPENQNGWCVLTGGEPMLQVDEELVLTLHRAGFCLAMETNGTIYSPAIEGINWLTVSPKLPMGANSKPLTVKKAMELKVIIDRLDGWTDAQLEELRLSSIAPLCYVQPQDPIDTNKVDVSWLRGNGGGYGQVFLRYQNNVKRCIEFVKKHPEWSLSLQTHKMVRIP